VPHRGELNHSRYMYFTALALATEREQTLEYIEKITNENARRFFRIK
jgi:Tat protein secretion system quality control protein TatD with DNase activity